ncbi:transcriptional regulator with XRE-family HTH domain [Mycolicibacterium sp. BK634]|uniref:helix-turn-helix domain-containing protein n=1 Tax=Mycolicibacterium sp. BK634 TaxID=2587099 RepID=UPI001831A127|nr:helix-turn-helix transcriptional regulator [Mycolicibacterium sp. BK634]MBB3753770.1 transcriptional regulator with XRE-family HTH domain [Mycolicibacterium sp. BK634]
MGPRDVLRHTMAETGTSQSQLARISGVRQPSISQFLSGTIEFSDDQIDRLLSCMGYRLEVSRRAVNANLTRSERRSWSMHRQLATHLTTTSLTTWQPTIFANIARLRAGVRGQPHLANIDDWEHLVSTQDVAALRRALTGVDRHSIEMREVTPMGGILTEEERHQALQRAV